MHIFCSNASIGLTMDTTYISCLFFQISEQLVYYLQFVKDDLHAWSIKSLIICTY